MRYQVPLPLWGVNFDCTFTAVWNACVSAIETGSAPVAPASSRMKNGVVLPEVEWWQATPQLECRYPIACRSTGVPLARNCSDAASGSAAVEVTSPSETSLDQVRPFWSASGAANSAASKP